MSNIKAGSLRFAVLMLIAGLLAAVLWKYMEIRPAAMITAPPANDIALVETIFNTDFVSAGFGGMRTVGTGTIALTGVSGEVKRALLYWHGPTNSSATTANASVIFNGTNITGTNIGLSQSNCWPFLNSQAYRADVTSLVEGNGNYSLSNFLKEDAEINGVSLIVFFDDDNPANNRDVVIFNGNDSNKPNEFDADGWIATLSGINYMGGNAAIQLHVSDGQSATEDGLKINGKTLVESGRNFSGDTVPLGTGCCGAPGESASGGGLWDIKNYNLVPFLTTGLNTVTLTTGYQNDCLSLIVALIDLPAGAAPPTSSACNSLDVAFVIDDTGSMGGAIGNVKTELVSILASVEAASGGDYQLALVTFKDTVRVIENFAPKNRALIEEKIRALSAGGGGNIPEASDEALNTVINNLPSSAGRQDVSFTPGFRPSARKVLILITDAPPAGFDDNYTPGVDDVNAHKRALEAAAKGIRISAILVPTSSELSVQRMVMRDYAAVSGGAFIETAANGLGTGTAISGIVSRCGDPPPPADLAISLSSSPNPVFGSGNLTHTISVKNNSAMPGSDLVLSANLPAGTTFLSLTRPEGWICTVPQTGQSGSITCNTSSLPGNATAAFTLTTQVACTIADGPITQTVSIQSTSDPLSDNNSAVTTVTAKSNPAEIRINIAGGKSSFDLGPVAAMREISASAPSDTFTIENPGCAPISIKLQRVGADVTSGKIVNPDDSAIFSLLINTNGTETPVSISPDSTPLQLPAGQSRTFRLQFHPLIPILSGKTTGLFANQAIPDTITSQLIITPENGTPTTVNVTARVATPLQLIHPTDSRLAPLIVFTRSALEYTVECSVHDPNLDLYLARYQFLDQSDRPVGQPADVELAQPITQSGLVRGQSFTIVQKFAGPLLTNVAKVRITLLDRETTVTSAIVPLGNAEPSLANVSAASFLATSLASESMVAAFGTNLAAGTQVGSAVPLPTNLNGTSVLVRDGAGAERSAPLFFVSANQINYQIPPGTRVGAATVSVQRNGQTVAREAVQISAAAPALFAANANGKGVAAAVALRASPNGAQTYESLTRFDQTLNQFVSVPLSFGAESEQIYLILFGAGFRHRNPAGQISARAGGFDAPVVYAGAQGGFVGLDQVNLLLPRNLAGRGEVDVVLTVDGKTSNIVRINFGGSGGPLMSAEDTARSEAIRRQEEVQSNGNSTPVIVLPAISLPVAGHNSNQRQPRPGYEQKENR